MRNLGPWRNVRIIPDDANPNNVRLTSDNNSHIAKVYGYTPEEAFSNAEQILFEYDRGWAAHAAYLEQKAHAHRSAPNPLGTIFMMFGVLLMFASIWLWVMLFYLFGTISLMLGLGMWVAAVLRFKLDNEARVIRIAHFDYLWAQRSTPKSCGPVMERINEA